MGEPGEQMRIWIICPNTVLDLTRPQQLLFLLNIMYLVPLRSTLNLMVTVHFTNKSSNLEERYFWSFCSYPTKPQHHRQCFPLIPLVHDKQPLPEPSAELCHSIDRGGVPTTHVQWQLCQESSSTLQTPLKEWISVPFGLWPIPASLCFL